MRDLTPRPTARRRPGNGQVPSPHPLGPRRSWETGIQVVHAGMIEYLDSWDLQRALVAARRQGRVPDLLLLLEHPPTYTIGRRGTRDNLLISDEMLARLGARCHAVDRGGDITFHGPGQLVAYVIMDLGRSERSIRRYVERLERTVLGTLRAFGVEAAIDPQRPGVWVGRDKIAALGIAASHAVTYHGFALNVDPELRYFDYMIPCGIPDRGVTSLRRELGRPVTTGEVVPRLVASFGEVFGTPIREDLGLEDLRQVVSPHGLAAN